MMGKTLPALLLLLLALPAATQMVHFFGKNVSKFTVLSTNIGHNMEHYGNLVPYMRMKGIVPPTSEQQGAMPRQKQDKSDKK